MKKEKSARSGKMALTSLLLVLLALAAVTAATLAWFTISDHTRVYSMDMQVTTGASLRFDLDPHEEFIQYTQTLTSREIFARVEQEQGFDPTQTPLDPVTTSDCVTFTLRNGTEVPTTSGKYLTFTLHFMATEEMDVHLTSANSKNGKDGTLITSTDPNLPAAMRISFTDTKGTSVYDPGAADFSEKYQSIRIFGLPQADEMLYNDNNKLFHIKKETNTPIVVHVWMEGTDEQCNNALKGGNYSISLRFMGTDRDGNPIG